MTNKSWIAELQRFVSLGERQKIAWMAALQVQLTIVGRTTYGTTEDSLDDPVRMRRINEALHKVSDQLLNSILGAQARPESVFVAFLEEEVPLIANPVNVVASLASIS